MVAMTPILKDWYEHLAEGRIMGLRCERCGAMAFPPVPVCGQCGGTDMSWTQMSGKATLQTFTYSPMGVPPYTTDEVMCAFVTMEEGPVFMSWLLDKGRDDQAELFDRMPLELRAETKKIHDDPEIWFPVFRVSQ